MKIGAGHVAHMGDRRGAYKVLAGRPEGKWQFGTRSVYGRILLKWIFKKWDWEA
jgi:hypothetical protein